MRVLIAVGVLALNLGCVVVARERRDDPYREPVHGAAPAGQVHGAVPVQGAWVFLGERTVSRGDRDDIIVGAHDGTFAALQFRVERSAIALHDMVVEFGDGQRWSPPLRYVFGPGSSSHVIDLPGGRRIIRRVTFFYSDLPGGGLARVELFGR
jgi:hypothetical protein